MIIQGGTGNGYAAKVDEHNRLHTKASLETALSHASSQHGLAFSWNAVSADIAGGETALLVCNDDPNKYLHIDSIYCWSDVPTAIDIHFPAHATWAGTAITGVNLNRTSGIVALATAIADETGQPTQGPIMTTLHTNELTGDQFNIMYDTHSAIVLGYHDSIGIDIVADSAAFECTIVGWFEAV